MMDGTRFRSCLSLAMLVLASTVARAQQVPSPGIVALQPGDIVKIEIWREDELSGEFLIDENGVVTLPLLGEKQVTGIPMSQLRDVLAEEYRKQLRNPSIQITPLRTVLVMGEVNKPGPYEVDPTATLIGVVALAEGATGAGNLKRIRIVRDGRAISERVNAAATLDNLEVRSGDQIVVGTRSWFARNTTFIVSVLLAIPSLIYTISLI